MTAIAQQNSAVIAPNPNITFDPLSKMMGITIDPTKSIPRSEKIETRVLITEIGNLGLLGVIAKRAFVIKFRLAPS